MGTICCPACGTFFETTPQRFTKPTAEEVAAHVTARGYTFDPETFWAHYEARGWQYRTGSPMKSWQAACVTWQGHDNDRNPNNAYMEARRGKALIRELKKASFKIATPPWVEELRRRIDNREPFSSDELDAMKAWEAGEPVDGPTPPKSWEEAEARNNAALEKK